MAEGRVELSFRTDTETIDRLFLELSQFTRATSRRELELMGEVEAWRKTAKENEDAYLARLQELETESARLRQEIGQLISALEMIAGQQVSSADLRAFLEKRGVIGRKHDG